MFDQDFFILLQAGLNQRSTETLSADPDWDDIYTLASQQTVQGIVADGISVMMAQNPHLSTLNFQPSTFNRFQYDTVSIIRRNAEINALQSNITRLLTDNNIKHLIVKGQEAARNYPKPYLRSAGDIDILLPAGDYERAKPLLHSIADSEEDEDPSLKHIAYHFGSLEVELHGTLHPNIGKRINREIDKTQDDLFNGSISLSTFNALYLFLHCMQHYYGYGLGLRQVIDWAMHLDRHSAHIDYGYVNSKLKAMHLTTEWSNFLTFSRQITSSSTLTPSLLPIWQDCKSKGNMGHYRIIEQRKGNFVHRNLITLHQIFSRYFRMRKLMPVLEFQMLTRNIAYLFNLTLSRLFNPSNK